jgi:hypothetical protein
VFDNGGCSVVANGRVVSPPVLIAAISSTNPTCFADNNGTLNLTPAGGTSPFTFQWSNGDNTEDVTSIGSGVYGVTITDVNGCALTRNATISYYG